MFKNIKIKNFRGIKDLEIKNLKKFNLFIGDNGSGKTNLLDAVFVAVNPNNPFLPSSTNRLRILPLNYWKSFFWKLDKNNKIKIKTEILSKNKQKREININALIKEELLENKESLESLSLETEKKEKIEGLKLNFKINEKKYKSEIELEVIKEIKNNSSQINPKTIEDKKYKETLSGRYLNNSVIRDMAYLSTELSSVYNSKQKDKVINFLKNFQPSITDIYSESPNNIIKVIDDNFTESVPINLYGDGIMKGIAIYLTSLNKENSIILCDEIENGLHWSKQSMLFEYLYKIAEEKEIQFFLTTHSRDTIKSLYEVAKENNFLEDITICRLEYENETNRVEYLNEEDLKYFYNDEAELR